jgi:phenazine biosynthesis protein phzE
VLASQLGLALRRRPVPAQGEQRDIDLFGTPEWVGFYNTFAAYCEADELPGGVEVARDPVTGEVLALRGTRLWSMQFHPESVLTRQGLDILRKAIGSLLGGHHDARRSAIRCD